MDVVLDIIKSTLSKKEVKKTKSDKPKKRSAASDAAEVFIHLAGEIVLMGAEILLIIGVIILIIILLLFLWVFIAIPLLLLILSILSMGDAWRMLRVFVIEFETDKKIELDRIIRDVHSQGGMVSSNWKDQISRSGSNWVTTRTSATWSVASLALANVSV